MDVCRSYSKESVDWTLVCNLFKGTHVSTWLSLLENISTWLQNLYFFHLGKRIKKVLRLSDRKSTGFFWQGTSLQNTWWLGHTAKLCKDPQLSLFHINLKLLMTVSNVFYCSSPNGPSVLPVNCAVYNSEGLLIAHRTLWQKQRLNILNFI